MPLEIISDPVEQQKILQRMNRQGRPNKYGAKKVFVDGMTFDSKQEYERWKILVLLERNGNISQLRRQVRYPFVENGIKISEYVADFVYNQNGVTVVEDAKGFRTRAYIMKRKFMLAYYGITILETGLKPTGRRHRRCR